MAKQLTSFTSLLIEKKIDIVLDTRFNPNCFSPFWKKSNLGKQLPLFNIVYHHEKNLGNTKYFEKGEIVIKDLEEGMLNVHRLINNDKKKICLLCTCANFETCHNKIIVENLEKIDNCKYIGRL